MWAITLVLDDFDANRGFIWRRASPVFGTGASACSYFIWQNWLPYRHNPDPEYNPQPWCDPENPNNCVPDQWIHSLRGDWNTKYWDKTANQAYHFWFYVAVTFFDGRLWAVLANNVHDFPYAVTHYDFSGSPEKQAPPPPNVPSQPDRDLAVQGMNLGSKLAADSSYQKLMKIIYGNCDGTMLPIYHGWTDTGDWIRFHLK